MKTNLSNLTILLAVFEYKSCKIIPPVNNHCIIIEYKTKPYKILIPKFLLSTAAVTQKGIKPIIIPLINKVKKLNQRIPSVKYLILSIIPLIQKTMLTNNTWNK